MKGWPSSITQREHRRGLLTSFFSNSHAARLTRRQPGRHSMHQYIPERSTLLSNMVDLPFGVGHRIASPTFASSGAYLFSMTSSVTGGLLAR